MGIVPTGYGNKANPVDNDSLWGYDSEGVANSNFLFSAIQTYVLNGLTTSEISEGTNLYYTDARVDARITGKADKTNVLELDNTTVFTPSADYEPATKKYVDDNPIAQSTTTVLGGNRILTDAEAIAGTDEVKTANAKQIAFNIVPGNATLAASTASVTFSNTTYEKKKEISVALAGIYRVDFNISNGNSGNGHEGFGRIYVNGVAVGTERSFGGTNSTSLFTENINVNSGDLIQLYMRIASGRGPSSNNLLGVYYATASKLPTGTVNL